MSFDILHHPSDFLDGHYIFVFQFFDGFVDFLDISLVDFHFGSELPHEISFLHGLLPFHDPGDMRFDQDPIIPN